MQKKTGFAISIQAWNLNKVLIWLFSRLYSVILWGKNFFSLYNGENNGFPVFLKVFPFLLNSLRDSIREVFIKRRVW